MKRIFIILGVISILVISGLGIFYLIRKTKNTKTPDSYKPPANNINVNFPLQLPSGFSIYIFAKNLGDPRVLIFDPNNNILVSTPSEGKVLVLTDPNKTGVVDKVFTIAEGLNYPHGLAIRKDGNKYQLFVAETDKLDVFDYDPSSLKATNKRKLINLPVGGAPHITRTLLLLPDNNHLLISIGSTCNVCVEKDPMRASVQIVNYDGTGLRTYSSGLRNSVFLAFNANTNQVWATNNGRDNLGDNLPPDAVNIIEDGKNYGWPYCYGNRVQDLTFDSSSKAAGFCKKMQPPHIFIQAHSAPLGLSFIPDGIWPQEYNSGLLVSYHGSWNRSIPTGYKVVFYQLDKKGNILNRKDFITGWLDSENKVLGRPVGLLISPTGVLYISDDKDGVIYRVIYQKK